MTRKDYDNMLNMMEELVGLERANQRLLLENNKMLKSLIKVVNHYIANADNENTHDFGRNILANLISNYMR